MQRTKIEYLSHTWNPIAMRCTPVSAGCDYCWHLRMANRLDGAFAKKALSNGPHFDVYADKSAAYSGGNPYLDQKELAAPLKLRKPAVIGVNFMGDLFHGYITNDQIAEVFGLMAACSQHTFMVLTKRPKRMAEWFKWTNHGDEIANIYDNSGFGEFGFDWPLQNAWLGVSVEDQGTADDRIPVLLKTPAEKRFVSVEPMLGPVDLNKRECLIDKTIFKFTIGNYLDWVICGAETGPCSRTMDLNWAMDLHNQCVADNVPFFFKKDSYGNHELDGRTWEGMP